MDETMVYRAFTTSQVPYSFEVSIREQTCEVTKILCTISSVRNSHIDLQYKKKLQTMANVPFQLLEH
ncbi:hypothetical protein FKM82_011399 [Ascaphus truei]